MPSAASKNPLGELATLDAKRRAVGREHVRHAGARQIVSRDDAWKIPARVEVRHVERAGGPLQVGGQAEGQEELMVIGQTIRHIREHVPGDTVAILRERPFPQPRVRACL